MLYFHTAGESLGHNGQSKGALVHGELLVDFAAVTRERSKIWTSGMSHVKLRASLVLLEIHDTLWSSVQAETTGIETRINIWGKKNVATNMSDENNWGFD
jgi:hypothetical protein